MAELGKARLPMGLPRAAFTPGRAGQTLVEMLVAVTVMGATALLVSGASAAWRAEHEEARDRSLYQDLARERVDRLLREAPASLLAATTSSMDLLALAPEQSGARLVTSGAGANAVDISSLSFVPITRSEAAPEDRAVDLMRLTARAAATKLLPLEGPGERYVTYKYQVTILRKNDAGEDVECYVLSALDFDHEK